MDYHKLKLPPGCAPIVYSPRYNITFLKLENLHPFDSKKYMRVHDFLMYSCVLTMLTPTARHSCYRSISFAMCPQCYQKHSFWQFIQKSKCTIRCCTYRADIWNLSKAPQQLHDIQKCLLLVRDLRNFLMKVAIFPNFLVRSRILEPMLCATTGSLMAGMNCIVYTYVFEIC